MKRVQIGVWEVDLATRTATNGDITVTVSSAGASDFLVEFSTSLSTADQYLIAREVLEAFERAGVEQVDTTKN